MKLIHVNLLILISHLNANLYINRNNKDQFLKTCNVANFRHCIGLQVSSFNHSASHLLTDPSDITLSYVTFNC